MGDSTKIFVAGTGGVGFWLSVSLLRAGIPHSVFDDDTFSGGLGHMRLPKVTNPDIKKVVMLNGFALAVMGDTGLTVVPKKFNGDEVAEGDLFIDCTDMPLTARKVVWEKARAKGARCLRISYDGRNSTVVVVEDVPLAGRPEGGYANVPDLALSLMAGGIGALAVQKILSGWEHYIDFQISLSTFFVNWDEALAVPVPAVKETAVVKEKEIKSVTNKSKPKARRRR